MEQELGFQGLGLIPRHIAEHEQPALSWSLGALQHQ